MSKVPEPGVLVEHQERDQHQHAARERVEEELDRRVDPPLVAPDPDEEVHRDEHGLPEHVEEEEVEGHEDPDHPRLEQQHEDHELAHPLLDRAPGAEEAQRGQEGGQDHEPQRQAVDADVVADAPGRDPGPLLDELQGGHVLEAGDEEEGEKEGGAGDGEADRLLQRLRAAPGERHEDGPRHGQEDEQAEEVGVHGVMTRGGRRRARPPPRGSGGRSGARSRSGPAAASRPSRRPTRAIPLTEPSMTPASTRFQRSVSLPPTTTRRTNAS